VIDGVHVFRGVPYAQPPVGALRQRPPRPAEPWDGVREATSFGPTAPQPDFGMPEELSGFYPTVVGDDYLNLNVFSPDLGRAGLPVMVWVHGGGFDGGSSILYDGRRFARDGVVFVSVNYRLGVEGFLALGDGIANLGLLDQVAALEWVRDNIAAFGGDPDNVTVFGESAGAMCTATLLAMPAARGLFRRVALQSGAGNLVQSLDTARHVAGLLADELGIGPTRQEFAQVPVERLFAAQQRVERRLAERPDPRRWCGEPGARVHLVQPTVDGDVLPSTTLDAVRAGVAADVDVLLGSNAEEGRLSLVPFGALDAIGDDDVETAMRSYGLPVERAWSVYRATHPDAGPGDVLALLQRDWYYRAPAHRLAEAVVRRGRSAYLYDFAWRSPQFGGALGACHFLEVPFVFDLLDMPLFSAITGDAPPQALADAMHTAWVAFATHGDPGWPRYDLSTRPVQRFDSESRVVEDPAPEERRLWEDLDIARGS
jgi:para-nitrobenzyl esterase